MFKISYTDDDGYFRFVGALGLVELRTGSANRGELFCHNCVELTLECIIERILVAGKAKKTLPLIHHHDKQGYV